MGRSILTAGLTVFVLGLVASAPAQVSFSIGGAGGKGFSMAIGQPNLTPIGGHPSTWTPSRHQRGSNPSVWTPVTPLNHHVGRPIGGSPTDWTPVSPIQKTRIVRTPVYNRFGQLVTYEERAVPVSTPRRTLDGRTVRVSQVTAGSTGGSRTVITPGVTTTIVETKTDASGARVRTERVINADGTQTSSISAVGPALVSYDTNLMP